MFTKVKKKQKWIFCNLLTNYNKQCKECCYTKYLIPIETKKFLLENKNIVEEFYELKFYVFI